MKAAPYHGPMDISGRILVVDDDPDIRELLASTLTAEGYDVRLAEDGETALIALAHGAFDLVLLDVMMPGLSGLELLSRIRANSDVTVLVLSARSEELDQLLGFALGADDYLPKPFRPRELAARVRARMRRIRAEEAAAHSHGSLVVGDLSLDSEAHLVALHEKPLALTPKEFAVLELLARHPGKPQSTRLIFEEIWGYPYDASAANSVMVHIRHLRQKMAAVREAEARIETVWGVGYKLVAGE